MEIIVTEMEGNRNLYNGTFSSNYTFAMRQAEWNALASRLNAAGGAIKTTEKWIKVSILFFINIKHSECIVSLCICILQSYSISIKYSVLSET